MTAKKKGVSFQLDIIDFKMATAVCELVMGFKGNAWGRVKYSNDMNQLIAYLDEMGINFKTFTKSEGDEKENG